MGLTDIFIRPSMEDVVREHGRRILGLLRGVFGAHADIDDVYQNVLVEVMRSLPRFQGKAKLSTWIHRVALNVAYQEMRAQYRRAHLVSLEVVSEPVDRADVPGDVARSDAARRVHAALAALPPKQRIAVALHDMEGCSLKEIADDLGVPLFTVASRVRVGRARLADALAELRGYSIDGPATDATPAGRGREESSS